jgi:hypothetical protein
MVQRGEDSPGEGSDAARQLNQLITTIDNHFYMEPA